jgi:hypothetical protein
MTYRHGDNQGTVVSNEVLTNVYDQTVNWLATKDILIANCIVNNKLQVDIAVAVVTNAVLTAVEDQTSHYLATKDILLKDCITTNRIQVDASSTAVTNAGLSNIDVSVNTLFTSTGIKVASMPSVAVTNAGLSNIDVSVNTLFTSTGIKVATMPSVAVTNAGLSNIDTSLNTLFTSTGIKVATMPSVTVTNDILTAIYDAATHFVSTKDYSRLATSAPVIKAFTIAGSDQGTPYTAETSLLSGRKKVWFKNASTVNIEIANASNSPTDYYTLEPMDMIPFNLDPSTATTFTFKYLGAGTVTNAIQRLEWE